MSKKTLLLIAGVAIMLAGATSAYAYQEIWNGWFNSGWLEYNDTLYTSGSSVIEDNTSGSDDFFAIYTANPGTFTCAATGNYIKLWPEEVSGSKPTGQSGQKEVNDGATWRGLAKQYNSLNVLIETFTVWGTWNTRVGGDCFDYTDYPEENATYSAYWIASYSNPLGITGEGGSAGELQE